MSSPYEISTEQDTLIIRVNAPGIDRESLQRLLDFIELEAVRTRSALSAQEVGELSAEVQGAAWDRVRHLFGAGGERG